MAMKTGIVALIQLILSAGGSVTAVAIYQERSRAEIDKKVAVVETRVQTLEVQGKEVRDDIRQALRDLNVKIDYLSRTLPMAQRRSWPPNGS